MEPQWYTCPICGRLMLDYGKKPFVQCSHCLKVMDLPLPKEILPTNDFMVYSTEHGRHLLVTSYRTKGLLCASYSGYKDPRLTHAQIQACAISVLGYKKGIEVVKYAFGLDPL